MAEDDDAHSPERRDAMMQRIRVGLSGLAAVFLVTLLAASVLSFLGQDDPHAAKLANGTVVANGAIVAAPPKEPLAELGVAPGGSPSSPTVVTGRPPAHAQPAAALPAAPPTTPAPAAQHR